jgi:hypothetical protein
MMNWQGLFGPMGMPAAAVERLQRDFYKAYTTPAVRASLEARGMRFGQTNLLAQLDEYCAVNRLPHKVFNIGSYVSILLLNNPKSSYEVEKAALKLTHRKVAYEHMFHDGMLDSYLINLGYLEKISVDVENHYGHLNTLKLDQVIKNVKFMLDRPSIKELSLQYNQPGNHRVNDGVGLIIPGLF